jgi:hypothetical protein
MIKAYVKFQAAPAAARAYYKVCMRQQAWVTLNKTAFGALPVLNQA